MTDVKKDAPTSKLGIVDRIMKTLKLDDEGRVYSFFAREMKKIEREITTINQNITVAKMEYDNNLVILKENLADAKDALLSAMENVDVDRIKSNSDKDSFATEYWHKVDIAEQEVEDCKKAIKELREKYDDEVDALNEEIKRRKTRIESFN
jgi:hypothetical protein